MSFPEFLTFQNQTFQRWTVTPSNSKTVVSKDVRLSAKVYFCRAFRRSLKEPGKKGTAVPAALVSSKYFDFLCNTVMEKDCKNFPSRVMEKVQVGVSTSSSEPESDTPVEKYVLLLKWPLNLFLYSKTGLSLNLVDQTALPQVSGKLRPDVVVQANSQQRRADLVSPGFVWFQESARSKNSSAVLWRWFHAEKGVFLYYLQTSDGAQIPCVHSEPFRSVENPDVLKTEETQRFLQEMEKEIGVRCVSLHSEFGVIALYSHLALAKNKKNNKSKNSIPINVRAKTSWKAVLQKMSKSLVLPRYFEAQAWMEAWKPFMDSKHLKELDAASNGIEDAGKKRSRNPSSLHGLSHVKVVDADDLGVEGTLFRIRDGSGDYLTAQLTYRDSLKNWQPNRIRSVLQPDEERASLWRVIRNTEAESVESAKSHQQFDRLELVRACRSNAGFRGTGARIELRRLENLKDPILQTRRSGDFKTFIVRTATYDVQNCFEHSNSALPFLY
jgi:hypothetical protein